MLLERTPRNNTYTSIIDHVFYVDPFQKVNFKTLDTTNLWFYSEDSFRKRRKAKPNSYRIWSQATSTIRATLTVSSGLVCDKFPCSAWTNFHPNKQTGTVKAACQRVPPNTRVFVGPVTMAPINVDPWRLRWGAARVPRHSIIYYCGHPLHRWIHMSMWYMTTVFHIWAHSRWDRSGWESDVFIAFLKENIVLLLV